MQHQPPDLQELVTAHGGWDRIPAEAWVEFERKQAHWRAWVRLGGIHNEGGTDDQQQRAG